MREYVIQNVDFIQLTVNPGEDRVYFPVSTHLQGKKVLYLEVLNPDKGLDLSGRYPILSLDSLFVTLYDTSGNLIVDTLFINYFSTYTGNDLPRIDSEIDWERSFISVPVSVQQTSVLFFSVYIGEDNLPAPSQKNLVNFYTSFVIYSKSALYKIHIAFKEQIRNKTVFFYNSVFFSFHLISFFALGNI